MTEPQKPATAFTDAELLQLSPQNYDVLTDAERTRLQQLTSGTDDHSSALDMIKSAFGVGGDLVTGAAKGAGETAFHLGSGVRQIPGIGNITDFIAQALGPDGTNPEQAFAQTPPELTATNTAQKVGKVGERIGEFVLPSKATLTAGNYLALPALNKWLSISQKARPYVSKALQVAEKGLNILGDAAMSAGVGTAQTGDLDAGLNAAKWSAGGALGGQGLSQLLRTLSTKTGQQIGPLLAAIAAMSAVESAGGGIAGTTGAGLGGFSVARSLAQQAIRRPGGVRRIRDAVEAAGNTSGQIGAGMTSGPRRRGQ